jgi:hypothetical protein
VPAIDEPLAPGPQCELTIWKREALEVEGTHKSEPICKGAGVSHDDRLHQAYLAESIIARNRIGVGVEENAVRAEAEPWWEPGGTAAEAISH